MKWTINFSKHVDKELTKIDNKITKRILRFLRDRVAILEDPRSIGESLSGSKLGNFWKYRVGDYRIICSIEDKEIIIFVVSIGHRKAIYK